MHGGWETTFLLKKAYFPEQTTSIREGKWKVTPIHWLWTSAKPITYHPLSDATCYHNPVNHKNNGYQTCCRLLEQSQIKTQQNASEEMVKHKQIHGK